MVSVIVCTYQRPELLRLALESLARQTAPAEDYEVIVVDNGPSAATRQVVAACDGPPRPRYVIEPRTGLSRARNAGCAAARGRYVAYMDDDAKAAPDWVEQVCRIIISDDAPGIFGGKIAPFHPSGRPHWLTDSVARLTRDLHELGEQPLRLSQPPLLWGSNMVIRKGLLGRLGGFGHRLGMSGRRARFGEETEFQMRALREAPEDEIWYFPQLVVYHLARPEKATMRWLARSRWGSAWSYVIMTAEQGVRHDPAAALRQVPVALRRLCEALVRGLWRDRATYARYLDHFVKKALPRIGQLSACVAKLRLAPDGGWQPARQNRSSEAAPPVLEMSEDFEEGLVSVITPTCNRAWIIEETLGSVRQQSYRPIEVVVVDDGSTDETEEVVRAFAESSAEGLTVRYVRQEQQGANAARNRGLEESRGEFIQFLDSDDLLLPDKLSDQVAVMQTEPQVEYVFSPFGTLEGDRLKDWWPEDFRPDRDRLLDGMVRFGNLPLWTVNGLYRRSICRRIGPWETRWQIHDRLYNAKLLVLEAPYRYIPTMHALMRRHERERWTGHTWERGRLRSHGRGWHEVQRVLAEADELPPRRRRILADSYMTMARGARAAGLHGEATRLTRDARQATAGGERVRMWRAALAERLLRAPFVGEAVWVAQREGVLGVLRRAPGRLLRALAGRSRRPGSRKLLARGSSEEGDR